ncbi:MAG: nucleotidyltransferase substrate binding protein [Bacteroidota bacterium]|jgi:nucleotidyltransferase substrate binding protein (TIGR01987 family)|nr:nucleotidyltransferase [Ignavibacteria bacterium]MCU7498371.1 nucleotidyltransferase [Ignavibacteria bacterium]MCU7512886.1 nucleotidyltransferase [Ignavibacteria bacterium]MCU7520265.1 nucleotidyltransferase [Ignavibacteria bacterium]MCU7526287.1 nucleotidyltransferase [Ignavibacteria bacterium]
MNKDIRWIQRFSNFNKALEQLKKAVELARERELTKLEGQGLIHAFEFTHELAWNTLKDFLESRGNQPIYGPKDASMEAFRFGLIENGDIWLEMIQSRNMTSHTYDEKTAGRIISLVVNKYLNEFILLEQKLGDLRSKEQDS